MEYGVINTLVFSKSFCFCNVHWKYAYFHSQMRTNMTGHTWMLCSLSVLGT